MVLALLDCCGFSYALHRFISLSLGVLIFSFELSILIQPLRWRVELKISKLCQVGLQLGQSAGAVKLHFQMQG